MKVGNWKGESSLEAEIPALLIHVFVLYYLLFSFLDFKMEIYLSLFSERVWVHDLEELESWDTNILTLFYIWSHDLNIGIQVSI